jgi:pimeloyl-ACP methyl ester carboxylesterase
MVRLAPRMAALALMALALPPFMGCAQRPGGPAPQVPLIVLVHSPLVGPFSWAPVAEVLRGRGRRVIVPDLGPGTEQGPPYFEHHAAIVAQAVKAQGSPGPVVLVAHSGAGVLLPAIETVLGRPAGARIFIDAIFPEDGRSRLDLFGTPDEAEEFRRAATNGYLPVWSDADLQAIIPDAALRHSLVAELRPLPLAVYEEKIPVTPAWHPVPCGYLRLSDSYRADLERARQAGCRFEERASNHFAILTEAESIADRLESWIGEAMSEARSPR